MAGLCAEYIDSYHVKIVQVIFIKNQILPYLHKGTIGNYSGYLFIYG